MGLRPILGAFAKSAFRLYYRAKFFFLRPLARGEAAAIILYASLFPDMVLRMFGAQIGHNVRIGRCLELHEANNDFSRLSIGDDVHIGKHVFLDLTGRLTIEERAGIGMFSRIMTHQNFGDSQLKDAYPKMDGDMIIPADTILSIGSVVLFPTVLTARTVIGSSSVVRGSYPRPCVMLGNPARIIKFLDQTE